MINAIIIDDEENNREVLESMIARYCPQIQVQSKASNITEGERAIVAGKPSIVFLDVQMPGGTGLELLQRLKEVSFELIFVTAYSKYAVNAFEFNAIDYLLKPISPEKLVSAVQKAIDRINSKQPSDMVMHFINTLSEKHELLNRISIHHNDKVLFIDIADISYIETRDDCTTISLSENERYYSSKPLNSFEDLFSENEKFIRISKNAIVNVDFVKGYGKGTPILIEMRDGKVFEVSRRRKIEVSKKLRN